MKFFTIALFLGAISAEQLEDLQDEVDMLKIRVSKAGQAEIEEEFNDIPPVMKKIQHSRPVRNLKNSLKKFAKTKEVANLKALDKKFYASPAGQKLIHEWKDVGHVLKDYLTKDKKTGAIHFPNKHMNELGDEINDVVHEYKYLEGSKWDKAYEAGFKAAFATKEAAQIGRRFKTFKASPEGQALKKEVVEFKKAVHDNLKVTDIPDEIEDEMDLVHIHVSDEGREAIEEELDDVEMVAKKIKMSRPVRNMKNSLKRWDHSQEMDDMKELDKKFLSSPEGKKLMLEWEDFGHSLKEHVKHDAKGIHVDHEGMQTIEDEVDDIEHEYKDLAKTKWAKMYDAQWKALSTNKEAKSVQRRFQKFKASKEWAMLKKELMELDAALKKHVKVTDVPKDVEEVTDMLHIQLSKQGQLEIEKEIGDVGKTMEAVKMTRSVRNMKNSLKRWGHSAEVGQLKALDKKFWASPEGKELKLELSDIAHGLDGHIKKTPQGYHIDHEGIQYVQDDLDDVDHVMQDLEKSQWKGLYDAAWAKATSNKEAGSVERRFKKFKASKEWAMLHKELHEVDAAIKKNLKVTDVPKDMEDDMYLF